MHPLRTALIAAAATLTGAAFAQSGIIYIADPAAGAIYVDGDAGGPQQASILSGQGVGTGPAFGDIRDIATGPGRQLYVLDGDSYSCTVVHVDPATGARTLVAALPQEPLEPKLLVPGSSSYRGISVGSRVFPIGSSSRVSQVLRSYDATTPPAVVASDAAVLHQTRGIADAALMPDGSIRLPSPPIAPATSVSIRAES